MRKLAMLLLLAGALAIPAKAQATHQANALRQSAVSTTACTISGTVNQNDVLTFKAVSY